MIKWYDSEWNMMNKHPAGYNRRLREKEKAEYHILLRFGELKNCLTVISHLVLLLQKTNKP